MEAFNRKMDYEEGKKFLLDNYSKPINTSTDLGQSLYKYMQRLISRYIGTRPINEGKILIHGHTHNENKVYKNMINVSVEAWEYKPASEEEIVKLIKEINSHE